MTVTIVSSLYGNKDYVIAPIPQTIDVDWLMITDGDTEIPAGWDTIIERRDHLHPRMAAKVAKCLPHNYTDSDITIWIDASIVVRPTFAAWCVESLGAGDLAQVPHPERQSITDEAAVSATMTKYQGQRSIEQAKHYTCVEDHPDSWGLWATGLIVRRSTPRVIGMGADWLVEQMRWTYQDQISQPVVLRRRDIRPIGLPGGLWHNSQFTVRGHRSDA